MKRTIAMTALATLTATAWAQPLPTQNSNEAALSDSSAARPLTQTEVKADLNLWRRAGMDQLIVGYETFDPRYETYIGQYRQLRDGPAYAEELQRLAKAGE